MKKTIEKLFLLLSVLVFSFFLNIPSICVSAAETKFISADVSVVCEENGTAHINETWVVNVDSGTEMYLGRDNLKNQLISNLKVSSDGKEYQTIENWNTKASLKEKAYKCGIIKDGDHYELCWGIGSYGTRTFNVSYDMTNLVKECSDGSFIDQVFINNLPSTLKNATITIERKNFEFTTDNTKIWAGGGAVGNIFIVNGKIEAKLTSPMNKNSNFAILSQFDKGAFSPNVFVDTTFQELQDTELEGTNYKNKNKNKDSESSSEISFFFIIPIIFGVLGALFTFIKNKEKNSRTSVSHDIFRQEYKNPNYSRDLPFNNNLFATYTRLKNLRKLKNECCIIGVYLLKWIQNHNVTLTKAETRKFFKTEMEDAIALQTLNNNADPIEKELFDSMLEASDKNQILRKNDFSRWCKKNYSSLSSWLERYNKKGFSDLKKIGAVIEKDKKSIGFISYTKNELSDLGIKLTSEMFGFKKYLEDFTIINEREAKEVELWKEYLVYAQLFGIADKVSKQFKNLYPNYFEEKLNLDRNVDILFINSLANSYAISAHNAFISAAAASGHGGSFGGGGFGGAAGGGSSGTR